MLSSEELLEQAAANGSFDSSEWPRVLETVLARLEQNVFKEFPIPSSPPRQVRELPLTRSFSSLRASHGPDTSREEAEPPSSPPAPFTPEPPIPSPAPASTNGPLVDSAEPESPGALPHPLLTSYQYIINTLQISFNTQPPHTIQRLAELVLYPRQHYRYVPSYLNALDRAVSVSSTSSSFPLPAQDPLSAASGAADSSNGTAVNGDLSTSFSLSPHLPVSTTAVHDLEDDSLGGALLTPIPWLQVNGGRGRSASTSAASGRERSSSPFEADADADASASASSPLSALSGSSPGQEHRSTSPSYADVGEQSTTANTGAVTQGELLRQEQATGEPPAPVSSLPSRAHMAEASPEELLDIESRRKIGDAGIPLQGDGVDDDIIRDNLHEQPHARGPDIIGLEDTGRRDLPTYGPAGGQLLDIEAAVGRASSKTEKIERESQSEAAKHSPDDAKAPKRKAEDDDDDDESHGGSSHKMKKDSDGDVELADVDGNRADDATQQAKEGDDAADKAT